MDQSQLFQNELPIKGQQAYKKIKVLGEGAMGKAYLVESTSDNKLYVMKRINIGHLNDQQKQYAMRQAQLHSIVSHPNIIAFKQIYHTTKDKLCIIMEYAQNGDLDQLIQKQKDTGKFFSQDTILSYFTQICLGLKEIHANKIIHRDLKGANIFLTKDMTVKIGDFGISKVIDQTVQASKSFVGTPYYLSPEMVQGKPYSTKADIWALGVLLYNLCSQRLPFQANSLPLLALKILKGSFPPLTGPYSKELKALILSMLQVDAKKRPSVLQILTKPILSKYVPPQQAEKIKAIKEKPKNTNKNTASTNAIGMTINTVKYSKKTVNQKKISQDERREKQQALKQEKKKKRNQEIKQMREDIRKKRNQFLKQKGSTKQINEHVQKKSIQQQRSPIKPKLEEQRKKEVVEKPWKTIKNKGSKKQVQFEILVPAIKPKQVHKEPQVPIPVDFSIQIKQFGKKPASTKLLEPNNQVAEKDSKTSSRQLPKTQEQSDDYSQNVHEQIEEDDGSQESQQLDYHKMMNMLKNAQSAVQGLNINTGRQIDLYEQSQNFDDTEKDLKQLSKKPQTPQIPEMNTMEQHSWNFIHNSDNLEECRQILEEGLGQERFIKAYHILSQHLDFSEEKKMRGDQLEDYTFNKQILRKKLDFLTDKQFNDYLVLMYTLIVIQIQEMRKNLDD